MDISAKAGSEFYMDNLMARLRELEALNTELRDELENANIALCDAEQNLKEAMTGCKFTPAQIWKLQKSLENAEKKAEMYRDLWIKERQRSEGLLDLYVKTKIENANRGK